MISVDSLLYKIDQRLNKLASNEHQEIHLEDKLLALNDAQILLIQQKMSGISVPIGIGFDGFRKRHEDLQVLIENYIDHPLALQQSDDNINQWTADLGELSPKYMFYVDSYIIADKGKCKDRIIWINSDLVKHGDVSLLLNNEHYKPSFEYQETFNVLTSDKMTIFTDGSFTPKKLYISYLRYPLPVDKEGYTKFDGTDSVNQDCELPDYLENTLLDLAILSLGMSTENVSAVQGAQLRGQTNE